MIGLWAGISLSRPSSSALVSEMKSILSYLSKVSTIRLNLVHWPQSASYAEMYLDEDPVCMYFTPDREYYAILHKKRLKKSRLHIEG
jgi:hypothetical protein